jgi:transcriptional regulator with XRE-family HTH domain
MNTQDINLELLSELEIPKYHDYFVASQLNKGFSFQMRALRANQDLTQKGLAELAGTKQSVISRTETNGVSNLSVKTLLKLASAFNVGLVLRFVSLEHLLDWKNPISLEELAPKKSKDILEKIKNSNNKALPSALEVGRQTGSKQYKFNLIHGKDKPTAQQPLFKPTLTGNAKEFEIVELTKEDIEQERHQDIELEIEHTNMRNIPVPAASTRSLAHG